MAGLGRKIFVAEEILAAADVNGYLMDQSVMVFADAAARTAAIATPTEGMISYLSDTNVVEYYDGSAWVNVAASAGDITAVTAGTALTGGGTTGDVTLNVDLAAITIPPSQITGVTATAAELNILDGVTSTAAELNILDGVTSTTAELNILDGVTATTAELNYTDGVTSNIQTQLNGKVDEVNGAVTTAATGSNVVRNITLSTSAPTGGADGDVWLVYTV
jgi:hypothetical protein